MPTATPYQNSNVDIAEANAYFDERLHAENWNNATQENQERALIMSTRVIDAYSVFDGYPTETDQPLSNPRTGLVDRNGDTVNENEAAQDIKYATMEYALVLLNEDTTQRSDSFGVSRFQAGPLSFSFDVNKIANRNPIPDNVWEFLYPYLVRGTSPTDNYLPLVRG